MNCLHCGAPVLINGVCTECGLQQRYLIRAWNTSLHYYNQGVAMAKIRNMTEARSALQMSLRYNKANIDSRNLLGLVYYETGYVVEALAQWVISSNYQPENNVATKYLAAVQGNQNRLNAYDQAAKKYNLTLHYMAQKNYDLALIQLKKILADNSHFVDAYLVLALIYMKEGNLERAKKVLQRVLRIDRYNPNAQIYLEEINKNGRQLANYSEKDSYYEELEEEEDGEEETAELTEEEIAKRKIRDIIERGAAAEDVSPDSNLEVGSYKEIKYGKHNVLYLLAGLAIGIIAMFVLVMPARMRAIRNEDLSLKSSYSAELSGKNVQIASLEEDKTALQTELDDANKQITELSEKQSGSSLDDSIMTGISSYLAGDKEAAITALGNVDLNSSDLSESTKACITSIVADCADELSAKRTAGMTAFAAENYDEALNQLLPFCNLNPDDVEARYTLAQTYEKKGDVEKANTLYEDINTRFPDSDYTSTLFQ